MEPALNDMHRVDLTLREGRFQRWLALSTGAASLVSGAEVAYEHYRGSYSQRIMYTPVILSGVLGAAGVAGFFDRTAAKTLLPAVSALTLLDGTIGFGMHVRGIARKPGGWRLPITNIVMGPPLFAPLLFGIAAYLGLVTSSLRRAENTDAAFPHATHATHWRHRLTAGSEKMKHEPISPEQHRRERVLQRQVTVAAIISAALSGLEAWYSHYKNNFRYAVQWTPLGSSTLLIAAGGAALCNVRAAHTLLPAASLIAIANGTIGSAYHVRGILRRPGGTKTLAYNVVYGPPVFAPMLFAASGFLGILASLFGAPSTGTAQAPGSSGGGGEKRAQTSLSRNGEQTTDRRPVDPATGARIGPLAQPGYYPGFSTLSQARFWDEATRKLIFERVENVPPIRFFTANEARLLEAVTARVIPQDDRDAEHRIPIVPAIDERLYAGRGDGYQYEKMPRDREAYRLGLEAIDEMAHAQHGRGFTELGMREQEAILKSLHDGEPQGAQAMWERMPAHRFWMTLVQDCAEAYYAHPWAWDEIGFGGPAYPRAYMRLENGEPEPWEVKERRYAWEPPHDSLSGDYEPVAHGGEHYASPGQGGTH